MTKQVDLADLGLSLDPNNEFERVLIAIANMHREKAQGYGIAGDEHWNFYEAAHRLDMTVLEVVDAFAAKHEAAWKRWKMKDMPTRTKFSDDAVLDLAVYAVIRKVIYDRG